MPTASIIAWFKNRDVRTGIFMWMLIAGVCVIIANVLAAAAR